MRTQTDNERHGRRWPRRGFAALSLSLALQTCLFAGSPETKERQEMLDVRPFCEALEKRDWDKASSLGGALFAPLERRYRGDAGFTAYQSKLTAAEFLARQMQQQLQRATGAQAATVANGLFEAKDSPRQKSLSITPARQFYDSAADIFARPVRMEGLTTEEKLFLAQYYDLRLRALIAAIARAGKALALVEPQFQGTHEYVLVLPLLHAPQRQPLNLDVLPPWMLEPSQLLVSSDSCLLHFELPFHAMALARQAAELRGQAFSELEFYRSAGRRSGPSRPHLATASLALALECIPAADAEARFALELDIIQVWLDSENYGLAAGYAKKVRSAYPDQADAGRVIWLYYYALSRDGNTTEILADIDAAIGDQHCAPYRARLLYIKWWALRRQRDQQTRVAALELELLKAYGADPMVAPILLSRATDALARQDYRQAQASLADLTERFPQTKAAVQAQRMLEKLRTIENVNGGRP